MIRFLYEIYKWIIAFPIIIILTIIVTTITGIGSILFGYKKWGYYPPHIWGKLWCWLLFIKVDVIRKAKIDPNTSYVFVANHQGVFDIPFMMSVPNMIISMPRDSKEANDLIYTGLNNKKPFAIRYSRDKLKYTKKDYKFFHDKTTFSVYMYFLT